MLWTKHATLDVVPHEGKADVIFDYKGKAVEDPYEVLAFQLELLDVPSDDNGTILHGDDITGTISYTMCAGYHNERKTGSLVRNFSVSGTLDKNDASRSAVSFTSKVFNRVITLSLQNMTTEESEAAFGQFGYPCVTDVYPGGTRRIFVNNSGHNVVVGHESSHFRYHDVSIESGASRVFYLHSLEETKDACYVLTFDDGKTSRHQAGELPYEYTGIPLQLELGGYSSLLFNCGFIYYDNQDLCTYTITPEIYAAASLPE